MTDRLTSRCAQRNIEIGVCFFTAFSKPHVLNIPLVFVEREIEGEREGERERVNSVYVTLKECNVSVYSLIN